MKTNETSLSVGDMVCVTPSNPKAMGRGVGKLVRIGAPLVRVKFDYDKYPIACLLCDCRKVSDAA